MDSSGSIALDESPPASLIPPQPSSRGLFFQSPDPEETPESLQPLGEETAPEAGDAGSGSAPGWSEELSDGLSDDALTSSPGSSAPDKPAQLLSKGQMRQTARAAVKMGGGMAHTIAAKTEAQKAVGLYLADDDDAVAIGDPVADLMHRRGDIVGGKLSPDANDFLRSMMGVAGYLAKQIQKVSVVRQIEAGQPAGEVQPIPADLP